MTDVPGTDNPTSNDPLAELPAYALDALTDEERRQVEALLASSDQAQAELRVYEDMLSGLATLVPARKAPSRLTADFRERLATVASAGPEVDDHPSGTRPLPFVLMRRPTYRLAVLAAAAAILVVAIAIVGLYRVVLVDNEQRAIQSILSNSSAQRFDLTAQGNATGKVTYVRVPADKNAVLVAELPTLPAEKQYQFWLIKGSQPNSGLVFSASQQASQLLVQVPDPASAYDTVGITVEPFGGSPGPTSNPIFVAKLTP